MPAASSFTPTSDHVIVWLDENMAVTGNYTSEKELLETDVDLTSLPQSISSQRINELILATAPELTSEIREHLIIRPLNMFSDENVCLRFIQDSLAAGKKVFLITSGQKGRLIVPQVHNILSRSIYVFCGNRQWHEQWARPYDNDIEIYDDDQGVFGKVISDIAIHYLTKGQNRQDGPTAAAQYLKWSVRLFRSATLIDGIDRTDFINVVNEELADIQPQQPCH